MERLLKRVPGEVFQDIIRRVQAREIDPQTAVKLVFNQQKVVDEQGA
jgi:hypothetical protein